VFEVVKNGQRFCAICPPKGRSDQLGRLLKTAQGFAGHASSHDHKDRALTASYCSYTFTVGNVAWCVVCEQQLAASNVDNHQATQQHKQRVEWETAPLNTPCKKRKQAAVCARPNTTRHIHKEQICCWSLIMSVAPLP
jgi:hypothetical protein